MANALESFKRKTSDPNSFIIDLSSSANRAYLRSYRQISKSEWDRLDKLSNHVKERKKEFLQKSEKIFNLSIILLEYSSNLECSLQDYCENRFVLKSIPKVLTTIMDPLWNLNQEITAVYNDLSTLYNDLVRISHAYKISRLTTQNLEIKAKLDVSSLNQSLANSFFAGKSVIAVLKENCFRLLQQESEDGVVEFRESVKIVSRELLDISEKRLLLAKKWVKIAITDLDYLDCKLDPSF